VQIEVIKIFSLFDFEKNIPMNNVRKLNSIHQLICLLSFFITFNLFFVI
jgi:hypothetical protein